MRSLRPTLYELRLYRVLVLDNNGVDHKAHLCVAVFNTGQAYWLAVESYRVRDPLRDREAKWSFCAGFNESCGLDPSVGNYTLAQLATIALRATKHPELDAQFHVRMHKSDIKFHRQKDGASLVPALPPWEGNGEPVFF